MRFLRSLLPRREIGVRDNKIKNKKKNIYINGIILLLFRCLLTLTNIVTLILIF